MACNTRGPHGAAEAAPCRELAAEFKLRRRRLRGDLEYLEELLRPESLLPPALAGAPPLPEAEHGSEGRLRLERAIAKCASQTEFAATAIAQQVSDELVKAQASQHGGEYQVVLNRPFFMRSRVRIRRVEEGVEIQCESDSADESEWFKRHQTDLLAALRDKGHFEVRLVMESPV
jgi:hypothetical protein